jgi:sec-independent protein translocase protein TatA
MGIPSGMELFVVVAVVVLLFGGKKIPELASGLGKGIKNFKSALKDDDEEKVEAKTSTAKIEEDKIEEDKIEVTNTKIKTV